MNGKITCVFLIIFVLLQFSYAKNNQTRSTAGNLLQPAAMIPNKIVIKFKEDQITTGNAIQTDDARINDLLAQHQIETLQRVIKTKQILKKAKNPENYRRIFKANYSGELSPLEIALSLRNDPAIEYAEPLYYHYLHITPNDEYISQQLVYYNTIEAPAAWDVVQGGQGNALIAIVDGGTDINHVDLAANIWRNEDEIAANDIDDDGNGFIDDVFGWNFANNSGDPTGLSGTPFNADHGTHTAGIASAVSNNSTGVAGASWNASIMAINGSDQVSDRTIRYGYEGIIYGAENGADIISCSWGRPGSFSQFEQDIINYASDLGAVVVASAGNENTDLPSYPASYQYVMNIAGTDASDNKYTLSNYGPSIDFAAPGVSILSTYPNNQYGSATGTSMSAPMAAGVIGLVKTLYPTWSGLQAAEQVRITADPLPVYGNDLGRGRINAYRAVSENWPSIRLIDYSFQDENQDGILQPGETVEIDLSLMNYLQAANNVDLSLLISDPYVKIIDGQVTVSSIGTLQTVTTSTPLVIEISEDIPGGYLLSFDLLIQSGDYQDNDHFSLIVMPYYIDLGVNNVQMTVTSIGRIGQLNPAPPMGTIGYTYKSGDNLLFEGALIAGTSSSQLSNSARGMSVDDDQDFQTAGGGDLIIDTPGDLSDQESLTVFDDKGNPASMDLRITQSTYAWQDSSNQDYVILLYVIRNTGNEDLTNFHFGFFFDWDIDTDSYETNMINYDMQRKMGIAYDSGNGPQTRVGVVSLSEQDISFRAIYNDQDLGENPSWGVYDGFSDEEKWQAISEGITYQTAGPADVSFVIANGPFDLPSASQTRLAFAMVAADDSLQLTQHADSAIAMWDRLILTDIEKEAENKVITNYQLQANYPNPFNPLTRIRFQLPQAGPVELKVFDLLGREVRTLINQTFNAGAHEVIWDGKDEDGRDVASGLYFYRFKSADFVQTRKMQLIR